VLTQLQACSNQKHSVSDLFACKAEAGTLTSYCCCRTAINIQVVMKLSATKNPQHLPVNNHPKSKNIIPKVLQNWICNIQFMEKEHRKSRFKPPFYFCPAVHKYFFLLIWLLTVVVLLRLFDY